MEEEEAAKGIGKAASGGPLKPRHPGKGVGGAEVGGAEVGGMEPE